MRSSKTRVGAAALAGLDNNANPNIADAANNSFIVLMVSQFNSVGFAQAMNLHQVHGPWTPHRLTGYEDHQIVGSQVSAT